MLALWTVVHFEHAPFIPTHDTVTCYQLTCLAAECSKQVFLKHSTSFRFLCLFLCLSFHLFMCCWPQILMKVCLWKPKTLRWIGVEKLWLSVYLCFTQDPNCFWNQGCRKNHSSSWFYLNESPALTYRKEKQPPRKPELLNTTVVFILLGLSNDLHWQKKTTTYSLVCTDICWCVNELLKKSE